MKLCIASGKGGAGKTTITAGLAHVWGGSVLAADLDVEAPNLHLFLRPDLPDEETVTLPVPELNPERCTQCGLCRDICHYGAVARFAGRVSFFPDMCHGCGGCFAVCAAGALRTGGRELGRLHRGSFADGRFLMGRSRIGEAMTPPLLRRRHSSDQKVYFKNVHHTFMHGFIYRNSFFKRFLQLLHHLP